MADRMARMWAPFSVQPEITLAAGAVSRVDILSILEVALGRSFRAWTVTRVVGILQVASSDTSFQWGLRVENENVALGSIDPEADSTANWILHGGIYTQNSAFLPRDMITLDNRSQRKSQGEQSRLYLYVENTGLVGGAVTMVGRALMLLP